MMVPMVIRIILNTTLLRYSFIGLIILTDYKHGCI